MAKRKTSKEVLTRDMKKIKQRHKSTPIPGLDFKFKIKRKELITNKNLSDKVECPFPGCGKTLKRGSIDSHVSRQHKGMGNVECPSCKRVMQASVLKKHHEQCKADKKDGTVNKMVTRYLHLNRATIHKRILDGYQHAKAVLHASNPSANTSDDYLPLTSSSSRESDVPNDVSDDNLERPDSISRADNESDKYGNRADVDTDFGATDDLVGGIWSDNDDYMNDESQTMVAATDTDGTRSNLHTVSEPMTVGTSNFGFVENGPSGFATGPEIMEQEIAEADVRLKKVDSTKKEFKIQLKEIKTQLDSCKSQLCIMHTKLESQENDFLKTVESLNLKHASVLKAKDAYISDIVTHLEISNNREEGLTLELNKTKEELSTFQQQVVVLNGMIQSQKQEFVSKQDSLSHRIQTANSSHNLIIIEKVRKLKDLVTKLQKAHDNEQRIRSEAQAKHEKNIKQFDDILRQATFDLDYLSQRSK